MSKGRQSQGLAAPGSGHQEDGLSLSPPISPLLRSAGPCLEIGPEKLLLVMLLLQAFNGVRSEHQLMERVEFDLLFCWFVRPGMHNPAWDHSKRLHHPLVMSSEFSVAREAAEGALRVKPVCGIADAEKVFRLPVKREV